MSSKQFPADEQNYKLHKNSNLNTTTTIPVTYFDNNNNNNTTTTTTKSNISSNRSSLNDRYRASNLTTLPIPESRKVSNSSRMSNSNAYYHTTGIDEAQRLAAETFEKLSAIERKTRSTRKLNCIRHGEYFLRNSCRNNKVSPVENITHVTNRGELLDNPNIIFNVIAAVGVDCVVLFIDTRTHLMRLVLTNAIALL
ncbi:unnamed protein product [Trichobilharzia regenti]|nr:unnamed protein product [Trichobilharzia regenti]